MDKIGESGQECVISQISGQNCRGGKVFKNIKVVQLEEPIKKGLPLVINGRQFAEKVSEIIASGINVFCIKTTDKLMFDVGFMKKRPN